MEEEIITPKEEVFDYEKLRYILNKDGYVCHASLGGLIVCDLGECTEYTGEVPKGYETIQEWYDKEIEKLNAWKIVDGNLVFDENKYNEIQKRCEIEAEENAPATHGWVNGRINKTSNVVKSELSNVASDSELLLINDSGDFEIPYLQVSSRGKLKEATGSNLYLSDSRGADIKDFKLYGKSTQETRSGKNVFDLNKINVNVATSNGTGINMVNIWGSSVMYNTQVKQIFEPSTNYICTAKVKVVAKPSTLSTSNHDRILQLYNSSANPTTYKVLYASDKNNWIVGNTYNLSCSFTTPSDLNGFNLLGYTYHGNNDGSTSYSANGELEITELMLRKATITDDTFELYGVSPSPDYPSEIKSVGYTNLFCGYDNMLVGFLPATGSYPVTNTTYPNARYQLIELKAGESVTTLMIGSDNGKGRIRCIDKKTNEVIGSVKTTTNNYYDTKVNYDNGFVSGTITAKQDIILGIMLLNNADLQFQITRGTQQHNNYIPFGKYGVEVETIGKNKLNPNSQTQTVNGITITNNGDGTFTAKGTSTKNLSIRLTTDILELKNGKTYTNSIEILSGSLDNVTIAVTVKNTNDETTYNYMNLYNNVLSNTKIPTEDLKITAYGFYVGSADKTIDVTFRVQLEENDKKTSWEEYKKTTTLIELDEPLKGLNAQDYLYLQNSNLYLKKNIGEVVLDGSENWSFVSNSYFQCGFNLGIAWTSTSTTVATQGKCNRYICKSRYYVINATAGIDKSISMNASHIAIRDSNFTNLEDFKTWLSNNNVKVQYQLAEPQDILIAENVDLLTYENGTNISTSDDLQPDIQVTYYAKIDENIPVNIKISNKNLLGNKLVSTTEKGVEFNVNEDKTITLNGTATGDIELFINGSSTSTEMLFLIKHDLQYVKSGLTDNVSLNLYKYDGTDRILINSGSNGNINLTASTTVTGASLFIASGTKFKNVTIAPMIEISDVETEYIEHEEVLKTGSFTSDNYTLIYENEPKTYEPTTIIMIDEFADIEANYFNGKIIERQQAEIEVLGDEIKTSVTSIEEAIGTIEEAINVINTTMLTQTADQFEMLFKQTGIKELVDTIDNIAKSNNATLIEQEQWIRFKNGNIELGKSDSQVKLLLSNDRISFMTGANESAYISNNQLYITDSTILNKLQVGHWETKEDEDGNLNTRWIGGVI